MRTLVYCKFQNTYFQIDLQVVIYIKIKLPILVKIKIVSKVWGHQTCE